MKKHTPTYKVKRSPKTNGEYIVIRDNKESVVIKRKRYGWKYLGSCYYPTLRDAIMSLIN